MKEGMDKKKAESEKHSRFLREVTDDARHKLEAMGKGYAAVLDEMRELQEKQKNFGKRMVEKRR